MNESRFKEKICSFSGENILLKRYGLNLVRGKPDIIGVNKNGRAIYIEAKVKPYTPTGLQIYNLWELSKYNAYAVIMEYDNKLDVVNIYYPKDEKTMLLVKTVKLRDLGAEIDNIAKSRGGQR